MLCREVLISKQAMPHPYTTTLMLIIFSVYCYSDTHQQNANQEDVHPGTVSKIKPVDGVVRKFDESAEVRCFPSVAGAKLSWYRNDELLTDDDKKYIISTENSSLTIKAAQTNDVGVYQCAEDDEPRVNVTLYSVPYVRGEKSINTSPGHSVTLDCKPRGLPVPEVTWYGSDQLILPDGKRFALKNSTVLNGQLVINNLEYSDYKIYTCVATNMYGSYNGTTLVRVKSPWRAIWPIIGIIIQLIILTVIIFFYEMRKKKEMEIEKRREAEFNKSHPVDTGRSEGVRQRKSN